MTSRKIGLTGETSAKGYSRLAKAILMLVMPVLVVVVASCDSGSSGGSTAARAAYSGVPEGTPKNLGSRVPDPKEVVETKPAGHLPDFIGKLQGKDHDRAVQYYTGAMQHHDEFSHIPCYCGCAIYKTAHSSLAECYIKGVGADGSIAFTDHSVTCDICQGVAKQTLEGLEQKTPLADIRSAVFKSFNYTGIWTDTAP